MYFASQAIHVPHTPPVDFDGDPEVLDRPVQGITGGRTSDDVLYELDLQLGALVARLRAEGLLVDKDNKATELYDLATDIAQERNLIADAKHGDLVARLRAKFLRHNDHDDKTFDEPRTTAPVGAFRK